MSCPTCSCCSSVPLPSSPSSRDVPKQGKGAPGRPQLSAFNSLVQQSWSFLPNPAILKMSQSRKSCHVLPAIPSAWVKAQPRKPQEDSPPAFPSQQLPGRAPWAQADLPRACESLAGISENHRHCSSARPDLGFISTHTKVLTQTSPQSGGTARKVLCDRVKTFRVVLHRAGQQIHLHPASLH